MRIAGKINYPTQQQKPLKENTAAYCFIGEIDLQKTSDGILVVGDECDSYGCPSILIFPPLKIKTKPIYENVVKGLNLCYENSAGVTVIPFDGKFVSPAYSSLIYDRDFFVQYEVDACFNKLANNGNGGWQFLISSEGEDHTIKLNVYVALCLDQISLTKITSKLQLETIPKDYVCAALIDFENARPYPFLDSKLPLPKFYHLVDKTIIHEHVHKKFFEIDIKTVLDHKKIFNGKLLTYAQHFKYNPNCGNNFTNLISAINEGKNYYRNLFKMFAKDLEKENNKRTSDFRKNENYTQWNSLVQETITEYQKALIKIWKDKNLPPNESPLTNCKYTFKDKWKAFYKWKNTFED